MRNARFLDLKVAKLAFPLIISNLTVPLVGLSNTAIVGHLADINFMAAIGVAVMIFNFIYWAFGFFRMGTTGLVAQAYGGNDNPLILKILFHSILLALLFGILLILFRRYIVEFTFYLSPPTPIVSKYVKGFFLIQIFSAPAVLINFVLIGFFVAVQKSSFSLLVTFIINIFSMILGFVFALLFDFNLKGIAVGDVVGQYCGLFIGIFLALNFLKRNNCVVKLKVELPIIRQLVKVNKDIFIRTLCLIFAFTFFTMKGVAQGGLVLAANTVLLNFMVISGYAQDGFANAAEALVGKNVGSNNHYGAVLAIYETLYWAVTIAVMTFFIYFFAGKQIINLITGLSELRVECYNYLIFVSLIPIVSVWCFFLDGIFIGANKFLEMRNTMIFSLCAYIFVWFLTKDLNNIGLWISILSFFIFRGVSMWVTFLLMNNKNIFFCSNLKIE